MNICSPNHTVVSAYSKDVPFRVTWEYQTICEIMLLPSTKMRHWLDCSNRQLCMRDIDIAPIKYGANVGGIQCTYQSGAKTGGAIQCTYHCGAQVGGGGK